MPPCKFSRLRRCAASRSLVALLGIHNQRRSGRKIGLLNGKAKPYRTGQRQSKPQAWRRAGAERTKMPQDPKPVCTNFQLATLCSRFPLRVNAVALECAKLVQAGSECPQG